MKAIWLVMERVSLLAGTVCLALFLHGHIVPSVAAKQTLSEFRAPATFEVPTPDTTLWSSERIAAYEAAMDARGEAIGLIRLPSVDIEAPIYRGSGDAVLDRGVGLIPGTAPLAAIGNTGLAAHRDGFFRPLKDVSVGDEIILSTRHDERTYTVTDTEIVKPTAVEVLAPSDDDKLTLVTCHPFYFVGSAPNRFIVHAERVAD